MTQKRGLLLIEEAPYMFRNMRKHLESNGFEIHSSSDLNFAQKLIQNQKIDCVIYCVSKEKLNLSLYENILKFDSLMPSIRLDPSQEYEGDFNLFQSEHLVLRHLGPKNTFTNILNHLIYIRNLKKSSLKLIQENDKINTLQNSILGKNKNEAYAIILEFLCEELKGESGFCWYWESQKILENVQDVFRDQRLVLHFEKEYKSAQNLSLIFQRDQCHAESIKFEKGYLFIPVLNEKTDSNLCFFAIKTTATTTELEFLKKEICNLVRTLERFYEIEKLCFIDDVTSLYNQRYLHVVLDQEIERVKRENNAFSVLFIDVDHFKNVNDKNGHLVGSQILNETGKILKSNVRTVDYCFRYGGDEFLILLTGTNTQQATIVAERIRKQIEATDFLIDGAKVHITLSIGIACFPEHAKSKKKIIQVADEAMYSGKNLTRNIVYVAS